MLTDKKRTEAILECYQELYKAAIPAADFDVLKDTCCTYVDENYVEHVTEQPLNENERIAKGWRKNINFDAYWLPTEKYDEITKAIKKKYKMTRYEENMFRTQIYLGCGPTSSYKTMLKHNPDINIEKFKELVTEKGYEIPKDLVEDIL